MSIHTQHFICYFIYLFGFNGNGEFFSKSLDLRDGGRQDYIFWLSSTNMYSSFNLHNHVFLILLSNTWFTNMSNSSETYAMIKMFAMLELNNKTLTLSNIQTSEKFVEDCSGIYCCRLSTMHEFESM